MENNENCCLAKILKVIDILQKECNPECFPEGCDKPFLGNTSGCYIYNTRPITLYNRNGNLFSVNYYVNGVLNSSSVFRVENVKDCCAKLRILSEVTPTPSDSSDTTALETSSEYQATDEFVTVNLDCFCVVKCLTDTYVEI